MLFTDPDFLFWFLPFFLIVFRLLSLIDKRLSNWLKAFIVISTLIFYGYRKPFWLLPFCIAIVFDFVWSTLLERTNNEGNRKILLACSITQNLLLLFIFKYLNWIISIKYLAQMPLFMMMRDYLIKDNGDSFISLPAGISFYLFESMSYVIDVYRRKITPPKNPLDFFSFIAMFPRFIAGPIVRYADLKQQMDNWPGTKINTGLIIFMIGFIYKTLFADNFAVFDRYAFDNPDLDMLSEWIGSLAYTFQLYFDFAGYSLMAIGLGKAMGFNFNKNFDNPYLAESITEFWKRWHMTLSSWLRDYLFIPLGGSRCSALRNYFNLFITMFLAGIWHGANWTFLVWGALQGIYLVLEKIFQNKLDLLPKLLRQLLTFTLIVLGWVIFRSGSLNDAGNILTSMFGLNGLKQNFNPEWLFLNMFSMAACLIGIIYCFYFAPRLKTAIEDRDSFTISQQVTICIMFFMCLCLSLSTRVIPFLYFQF